MYEGKYIVFTTKDHVNYTIKRFDTLDGAYRYYLEDMMNRVIAKEVEPIVREKN